MKKVFIAKNQELKDASRFGGKASNLHKLIKSGFNVPEFIVISCEGFQEYQQNNNLRHIVETFLSNSENESNLKQLSENIKQCIFSGKFSELLWNEISRQLERCGIADCFLAVRSSAVGEDSAEVSFAGQMATYLFVKGKDNIINSVKQCWISMFSENSLVYRKQNHIHGLPWEISVIIQKMVESDISGVVFTFDTIHNNDNLIINSVYGQGEGLVSGKIEADTLVITRKNRIVEEDIVVTKKNAVMFKEGGGTEIRNIEENCQNIRCLPAKLITKIVKTALLIEKIFKYPQDIEFGISHNKLYILQARPVTFKTEDTNRIIWDNSNIVESYSGVTSPLTFSFIRQLYEIVYKQFVSVMGVKDADIKNNEEVFQNMLGLIRGEVYYNLKNWYKMLSMLPGYEQNKLFMEQMMGVKERFNENIAYKYYSGNIWYRISSKVRMIYMFSRIIVNCVTIGHRVKRFNKKFDKIYIIYSNKNYENESPWVLMHYFHYLKNNLVWNWKAPILTDFFSMIFYGILKKIVISWFIDPAGNLQNDLLCGQGEIESTKPIKEIIKIAIMIKKNEEYCRFITSNEAPDVLKKLSLGDFPEIKEYITDYLDNYGFRGINELKLEEPSLKDKPEFLIKIIKNYLNMSLEELENTDKDETRLVAEQKVISILKARFPYTYFFKKIFFDWVLNNTKGNIRNRENMRFKRSKIFDIQRRIANSLGNHFYKQKVLDDPKDIYYLDINEIFDYIKGTAITANLRKYVEIRKSEFEEYRKTNNLNERIETTGMVYLNNDDKFQKVIQRFEKGIMLKGIACSPGIIRGKIKIILVPDQDDVNLNGEILVTKRTDPGWVTFYPSISGLIIEKGSILSHSAIVAREMGIPTVVGITGLVDAVKNGQTVEVNGTEGTVKLFD
jgi:pyruvate,water dikinase